MQSGTGHCSTCEPHTKAADHLSPPLPFVVSPPRHYHAGGSIALACILTHTHTLSLTHREHILLEHTLYFSVGPGQ